MTKHEDLIANLTTDDIVSVYSGKDGRCCCGCAGKHRTNPKHRELNAQRRGYAVSDDEVSARSVAIVLGKLKRNIADCEVDTFDTTHVAVVIGDRVHIAYLR